MSTLWGLLAPNSRRSFRSARPEFAKLVRPDRASACFAPAAFALGGSRTLASALQCLSVPGTREHKDMAIYMSTYARTNVENPPRFEGIREAAYFNLGPTIEWLAISSSLRKQLNR